MLVSYRLQRWLSAWALGFSACVVFVPNAALAQWQWVDAQGQRVYSDRPPGNDIPEKNILQRPKSAQVAEPVRTAAVASPTVASVSGPKAAASAPVDKNKILVQELNNQIAEQNKAIRARNCTEARQQLATLRSGSRIGRINDKGEREILEDAAIAAEIKRAERVANSECQ